MKQFLLCIFAMTMLLSCSKENGNINTSPGNNNSDPGQPVNKAVGIWVHARSTSDAPYDWNGTGESYDALKNCKKDNTMDLKADGMASVNEGTDLCWLAQPTFNTQWYLTDTTFTFNNITYRFGSLTDDTLKFTEKFITSSHTYMISHVWGKKK